MRKLTLFTEYPERKRRERTLGSKTFQYQEEKKLKSIA